MDVVNVRLDRGVRCFLVVAVIEWTCLSSGRVICTYQWYVAWAGK